VDFTKRKIKVLILGLVIISSGTIGALLFIAVIQSASPTARYGSSMVYDPVLQKTILFGGGYEDTTGYEDFNDMWLFDPTSNLWTEINPTVKPSARSGHSMVYDSTNHKTILFGGWVDNVGLISDTWIFDSQTNQWTEVFPVSNPSSRQSHSMYYDPDARRVILFGGHQGVGGHLDDMWEYNYSDNMWTELSSSNSPSGRYGSKMVYDPLNQRTILFGGRATSIMDDTWIYYYGNNTWTKLNPTSKPGTRYWHGMVYDSNNHKVIVFGGTYSGALGDTWIFDPSTNEWAEVLPSNHPSNRLFFTMVYDSNSHKAILFGGIRSPESSLGDTWAYSYGSNSWSIMKGDDL